MAGRVRARLEGPKRDTWLCVFFRASLITIVASAVCEDRALVCDGVVHPRHGLAREHAGQGVSRHVLFDLEYRILLNTSLNSCLRIMSASY